MTTDTLPERGDRAPEQSAKDLFGDIKSTADAIEKEDWLAAASGVADVALDIIGLGGDPLGAISSAGLGWVLGAVSFLREPFDVLLGSPAAITSSAQAWAGAAQQISSTAQEYKAASAEQTKTWQGSSGDGYRATGERHADGLAGLAEASRGMASAMTGAGKALAQARKVVLDLINDVVRKIIEICVEALSMSWLSFGSSVALGIARSVSQAVQTAQRLLSQLKELVSALKKIIDTVRSVINTVKQVKGLIEQIGGRATDAEKPAAAPAQPVDYQAGVPQIVRPAAETPPRQDGPLSQNGWPADPPRSVRTIPGTNVRITVADGPAGDVLLHVLGQVHQRVENVELRSTAGEADDWGYAHREVRGGAELSNHASGTAVDVNATRHVLGARDTFSQAQVAEIHRILGEVDGVVRWGGDYTGRADEMHFEIIAPYADVARVATRLRAAE